MHSLLAVEPFSHQVAEFLASLYVFVPDEVSDIFVTTCARGKLVVHGAAAGQIRLATATAVLQAAAAKSLPLPRSGTGKPMLA